MSTIECGARLSCLRMEDLTIRILGRPDPPMHAQTWHNTQVWKKLQLGIRIVCPSPLSQGILQKDMRSTRYVLVLPLSGRHDRENMRERARNGTRNPLFVAAMPAGNAMYINARSSPDSMLSSLDRRLGGAGMMGSRDTRTTLPRQGEHPAYPRYTIRSQSDLQDTWGDQATRTS
jgi:hypothetical protein